MIFLYFLLHFFSSFSQAQNEFRLPIETYDPEDVSSVQLTTIGQFGLERIAREKIPAHLHTGIDIKRPKNNYLNAKIYPISQGIVISKRIDGPYAQLIIEHDQDGEIFWTVYEHISEIEVALHQKVNVHMPLARFFNREELNQYGWQFDHFHFEILKQPAQPIRPASKNPERRFNSYTLSCFDQESLSSYFHNPLVFLKEKLTQQ